MKIFFISYYYYPPHFGGGLLHTIERFHELSFRNHIISVFTSGITPGTITEKKDNFRIKRYLFLSPRTKFSRAINRFAFFIKAIIELISQKYDLVQFGSLPGFDEITSSLMGSILLKIIHIKKKRALILYSLAESDADPFIIKGFSKIIRLNFFRKIDHIIVNSPLLYKDMVKKIGNNVKMILNGADDQTFLPDKKLRNSMREQHEISASSIVFTFVGTISKRKGVDLLIAAFLEVEKTIPDSHLWLIGPSTNQENQNISSSEFEQLINQIKDNPKIKLWGRVDDRHQLSSLLNASDIFVFPTLREGMPMAPLQAMATGLPVIISMIPGVTDIANIQNETGLFVKPGDKCDLKTAMVQLALDESLREKMGKNARNRIEQDFSWEKHIDNWEKVYLEKSK